MISIFSPTSLLAPSPIRPRWTSLSGPDAADFLHRLTTVNVKRLDVDHGAPGCFLTPQGKIRATFTLWRYDADGFAFEYDAGREDRWKASLLTTIDQFTFAEKMNLLDISELECVWLLGDELPTRAGLAELETRAYEGNIRLSHHGSRSFGRPWLTAWGRPAELTAWIGREMPESQPIDFRQLEEWRIGALRPRVDAEILPEDVAGGTNPLEVGLLDHIAENKGCYPGQEVIEKIISLGAPPRRLARIEGEGTLPSEGGTLLNGAEPPAEVGVVTSVAATPALGADRFATLALLRKIHAKDGLEVRFASGARGRVSALVATAPEPDGG